MKSKKRALGRGLDAILQSPDTDITSKDISGNYVAGAIANIAISKIEVNPFQPRSEFDDEMLAELAASISEQGIIQPLTVRKLGFDKYQLISGERRLRSAILAGFQEVPCFIRVANDEQMLELALIENTHREDLNAVDIAISYQRLIEECNLTQDKLSKKVGKKRATISNYIRLLKLPAEVQMAIKNTKITMGHARAIVNIENPDDQIKVMQKIIIKDLSVRQTEEEARSINKGKRPPKKTVSLPEKYVVIQENLSSSLSHPVSLKRNNNGKGSIVISFGNDHELEQLIKKLT